VFLHIDSFFYSIRLLYYPWSISVCHSFHFAHNVFFFCGRYYRSSNILSRLSALVAHFTAGVVQFVGFVGQELLMRDFSFHETLH